ncbi:MAG: hypothetical protein KDE19_22555 [Caldilineaceae bacterium]|nr:hypothetical protein [Caldilineaceae bacterium]
MNKQQAEHTDVFTNSSKGQLIPLQTEPLWNGCGKPTAVHDCVIIKHRARQAVTAMHTLSNQLRLFSWRVNADGDVVCTGATEGQGEEILQIDLIRIDPVHAIRYVTAWRTRGGELYLQCWDVSNTGAFYPSGPAHCAAEGLEWIQLLALGPDRLLTIGLGQDGLWHLTQWQVNQVGELEQQAQRTFPAFSGALAAAPLPTQEKSTSNHRFVTVFHVAPDTLRWLCWDALPSGEPIVAQTWEEHHANIIKLEVTTLADQLITLLHRADGQLQLVTHPIYPGSLPQEITQVESNATPSPTTLATRVRHFAISHHENHLLIAYTACAQQTQPLTLLRWPATATPPEQASVPTGTTLGTLSIDAAHSLALCDQSLEGYAPVLTAVGLANGGLQLTTWGAA